MLLIREISICVEHRAVAFLEELNVVALCVVRPTGNSAFPLVRLNERPQLLYALAIGVDLRLPNSCFVPKKSSMS